MLQLFLSFDFIHILYNPVQLSILQTLSNIFLSLSQINSDILPSRKECCLAALSRRLPTLPHILPLQPLFPFTTHKPDGKRWWWWWALPFILSHSFKHVHNQYWSRRPPRDPQPCPYHNSISPSPYQANSFWLPSSQVERPPTWPGPWHPFQQQSVWTK